MKAGKKARGAHVGLKMKADMNTKSNCLAKEEDNFSSNHFQFCRSVSLSTPQFQIFTGERNL